MDFGNFFSPYHKIIESQELKKGNLYLGYYYFYKVGS